MSILSFNHDISLDDIVLEMDREDAKEMTRLLNEHFGNSRNLIDELENYANELIIHKFSIQSSAEKKKFIELKEILNQIL